MANAVLAPVVGEVRPRPRRASPRLTATREDLLAAPFRRRRHDAEDVRAICRSVSPHPGIAAGAIASRHVADALRLRERDRTRHGWNAAPTSRSVTAASCRVTKEWWVEYGYPICFPSIEVLTIGAGGGSIAWIDDAGSLRNGPQSAGATPGPACYLPRWRPAHEQRCERRPRTPGFDSSPAERVSLDADGGTDGHIGASRTDRSVSRHTKPALMRSSGWRTPTWPTRCASSRSAGAMTHAISPSLSSAAPDRCTALHSRRSSPFRQCSCLRTPVSHQRSAASSSTSVTTSR